METGPQSATSASPSSAVAPRIAMIIGFLLFTELVYGILRGFYGPIVSDIADHIGIRDSSFNWFETAQHSMAAFMVLVFSRLGDIRGHKRVLLWTTAITAVGSWILVLAPSFTTFLVGYALQGACAVWLSMEIAIIYKRTAGSEHQHRLSRRAAGILVAAFYLSIIIGAVSAGALVGTVPLAALLSVPAVLTTACVVVVWLGIEDDEPATRSAQLDWAGLGLLAASLGAFLAGMVALHLQGPGSVLPWTLVIIGLGIQVPFARYEAGQTEPMIDVKLLRIRAQWPVQLAALLYGIALLGAEIPIITYFRTDPDVTGYGLGTSAEFVSVGVLTQVVGIAIGALTAPLVARRLGARRAVVLAAVIGAVGISLWVPFHDSTGLALVNLGVTGLGAGAVMASLPVLAATAAPADRTGFATGMTNAGKTIGGAIASAVFAVVLSATGSLEELTEGYAPFSGYLTVWITCGTAGFLAAVALWLLPRSLDVEPLPTRT